ncbi:PREDICTED: T-cell activation Rho GTPase-activating protein-like, partial [Tinamus guttatus]|uniref:T-cell activation Rho GTPase-activating protein-like n=1 Tax=Tinamus guttatus TaxID=94827 RepID=UPI00052EF29F
MELQHRVPLLVQKGQSGAGRKCTRHFHHFDLKERVFCVQVTVLVEFLIDNWAAVFGEDTALNFSRLEKESHQRTGSSTEHPKATQQNGFAHGSPDAEAECSPCTSETEQPEGRSTIMSRRYPTCVSAPSLPHFTNDVSTMDRRYSEPDLSFENCLEGRIRDQKLTKSEDNFPVLQRQLRLKNKALEKQVSVLPSQLSNDSLPRSFSSCSLESSFSGSEGSVFISSPLDSPTSPKKTFLNRPQSFSAKPMENSSTVSREIKKHSMSFSFANRRKTLTKTQSWGPGKSTDKNPSKENSCLCSFQSGKENSLPSSAYSGLALIYHRSLLVCYWHDLGQ